MRLFTVPKGNPSFSAISRYLKPETVHGEGNLVLPWKGVDNAVHLFQVICAFCAFKSGVARQVQVIEIVRGIHESLVTHHFAVIVDEDIAHDGVYPSFEISIGRILLFVIQSFQGCFLQEVVGFFTVGSKFVCKTQ